MRVNTIITRLYKPLWLWIIISVQIIIELLVCIITLLNQASFLSVLEMDLFLLRFLFLLYKRQKRDEKALTF